MQVCFPPGAQGKDITTKLPVLVWPLGYYPLLLFHVAGGEAAMHSPNAVKRDFRTLGQQVRKSEARVIFCSLLPVAGNDFEETDAPSLLIYGFMAGVTATILLFLIIGWPTWHQMGFTFRKHSKGSLLTS